LKKSILIVVYIFPPNPGIGGRRWAKYAKYFTRLGYDVHVICSQQTNPETSLWAHDVKDNPNIFVHRITEKYPSILGRIPKTVVDKIRYRLEFSAIKRKTQGSIFDRSMFWQEDFLSLARQLIQQHQIEKVFTSIAPMNHAFELSKLIHEFPNTKFVADFRDPWSNGKTYGFPQAERNRQEFEEAHERNILQAYHLITTSVAGLSDFFQSKYGVEKRKIYQLDHAIDVDDFKGIKRTKPEKLRILFNGSMYEGLQAEFDAVFKTLKATRDYEYKIDFFTPHVKPEYVRYNEESSHKVEFHQPMAANQFFQQMASSSFILILYPEKNADFLTTKFYEIFYLGVPIIYVCKQGYVSELITKNNLGIHILPTEIEQKLPDILQLRNMKHFNENYDISSYTFEKSALDLLTKVETMK